MAEINYEQWLAELESFSASPPPVGALTTHEWCEVWNVPYSRARQMIRKAIRANFMKTHRVPCKRMDGITSLTSGYALNPPEDKTVDSPEEGSP